MSLLREYQFQKRRLMRKLTRSHLTTIWFFVIAAILFILNFAIHSNSVVSHPRATSTIDKKLEVNKVQKQIAMRDAMAQLSRDVESMQSPEMKSDSAELSSQMPLSTETMPNVYESDVAPSKEPTANSLENSVLLALKQAQENEELSRLEITAFIEQFKSNARQAGYEISVDPETLKVTKVQKVRNQ